MIDKYLITEKLKQNLEPFVRVEKEEWFDKLVMYIKEPYIKLRPLINKINSVLERQDHAVIVLDGRCASGKTTAAEFLSSMWDAPVIHMDDFFLPPELRTAQRLAEIGGNVHYERFSEEVLPGLINKSKFTYKRFDCSELRYTESIEIPSASVIIVEGAYSMHPVFEKYWEIAVFFDVSKDEQMSRIIKRNGKDRAEAFREKWIPMEENYIQSCKIQDKSDFIII